MFQIFDGLDKLLNAASLPEYQQDGKPLNPNDKESEKFKRKLRDYQVRFQEFHHQYSLWVQAMEAVKRDEQFLKAAQAMAQEQVDLRIREIARLEAEKTERDSQADAVVTHRKAVEAKLAQIEALNQQLEQSNQAMVAEIARIQLEATRRIRCPDREDGPGGQVRGKGMRDEG